MFGLGAIGTIRAFESDMNKLCLLVMVFSLTAFSQANESVLRDIQAKYNAIATICTIDIKQAIPRTEKLLTSDYTWVDSMGAEFSREPYLSSQSRVVAGRFQQGQTSWRFDQRRRLGENDSWMEDV